MLNIERHFTSSGETAEDVFNAVNWVESDAVIQGKDGEVFRQNGVLYPDFFSENAIRIVSSKYFFGRLGSPERESSLKQLISRVVNKIADEGNKRGYFDDLKKVVHFQNVQLLNIENPNSEYNIFKSELTYLLLHQMFSFNSPIYFNVGTPEKQFCNACFILGVKDDLDAILENVKTEGRVYKTGGGIGGNYSPLRGSDEPLSKGGVASGPISFLKGFDKMAGVVKSGGRLRRSASMRILDDNHPNVEQFITCKSNEEQKARILAQNGYDDSIDGEAYGTVSFQNANHSIMIVDKFMNAVLEDADWDLTNRTDGSVAKTIKARELWNLIANEAWHTGDPGILFKDTINKWDSCPQDGEIVATNPCVIGDTIIRLDTGDYKTERIKIKDAIGRMENIYSVNPDYDWDQAVGFYPHEGIVKSGTKQCITIYLEESKEYKARELTLTLDHKVLKCGEKIDWRQEVKEDLVEASSLSIGDWVVVLRENSYCFHPYPAKIIEIESAGEHEVYDVLNVKPSNLFIANDIVVSNCAEYIYHDWTACLLASLNLLKFQSNKDDSILDIESFCYSVKLVTIAQNICLDFGDYPVDKIKEESAKYRTIGLGYANLGGLLMTEAIPYDSDEGRHLAASITALTTAKSYETSFELAKMFGPYEKFSGHHTDILIKHVCEASKIIHKISESNNENAIQQIAFKAYNLFSHVIANNGDDMRTHGLRNAFVSCIAPTGSIGLMMDCQTNGCEPELSLVKYKKLVGGGTLKFTNPLVEEALEKLGYNASHISLILSNVEKTGTIEAAGLENKDLPIFDCSFKSENGERYIAPEGHVKMLAAIQPFLSGASSKTVNMPQDCTVEDIQRIYQLAWELGVKCIAVYRDGCKISQPLTTVDTDKKRDKEGSKTTTEITRDMLDAYELYLAEQKKLEERMTDGDIDLEVPLLPPIKKKPYTHEPGKYDPKERMNLTPGETLPTVDLNIPMPPVQPTKGPKPKTLKVRVDSVPIETYENKHVFDRVRQVGEKINKEQVQKEGLKLHRKKMPDSRKSVTHKVRLGENSFYITVGLYEDGSVGEVFITNSRHGSFASGTLDAVATFISFCLQYGAPLEDVVRKLKGINFAPSGITGNKDIPLAKSILDYLGKYLEQEFLLREAVQPPEVEKDEKVWNKSEPVTVESVNRPESTGFATGIPPYWGDGIPINENTEIERLPKNFGDPIIVENKVFPQIDGSTLVMATTHNETKEILRTGQICSVCGEILVLMGRCFYCNSCGSSTGGCS